VDNYPVGPHVEDARQRIQVADDRAWTAASTAGTMMALNQYLAQFPGGAHLAQAQSSVAAFEQKSGGSEAFCADPSFRRQLASHHFMRGCGETKGYTVQLAAQVKDGTFHGHHGVDGQPDFAFSGRGQFNLDGSVELFAQGLTGNPRTTFEESRQGSPFAYHIEAKFETLEREREPRGGAGLQFHGDQALNAAGPWGALERAARPGCTWTDRPWGLIADQITRSGIGICGLRPRAWVPN